MVLLDCLLKESGFNKKYLLFGLGLIVVLAGVILFFYAQTRFVSYYYTQGLHEFNRGNHEKAGELFNRSLKYDSKNPLPYFYLGKIFLGKHASSGSDLYPDADYQTAISHFEKSLMLDLDKKDSKLYSAALNDAGFSYWTLGENDKAVEKFLKQIEVDPDRSYVARYFVSIDYFSRLNKPKDGLDILLTATNQAISATHKRNLFRAYALLARFYNYFKDFSNVEKYAKLAIEKGGDGNREVDIQIAHILLAQVFANKGDLVSAGEEIKTANQLFGKENFYGCSLSQIYFIGKDYSRAISTAKLVNPSKTYLYSTCLQVLADISFIQGNKLEAVKYMSDYLNITDVLKEKNIFVMRNRERFAKELGN